jgi:hypothetical protein
LSFSDITAAELVGWSSLFHPQSNWLPFHYGYGNFASTAGQLWANHFATLTKVQRSCLL